MSILSEIIENALAGVPTSVPQGGEQRDDMLYVEDVAEGVVGAALADRLDHPSTTSAAVARLDAAELGVTALPPEQLLDVGAEIRNSRPSDRTSPSYRARVRS
jgi:nucleoside-diphosphate-sugar epimerase